MFVGIQLALEEFIDVHLLLALRSRIVRPPPLSSKQEEQASGLKADDNCFGYFHIWPAADYIHYFKMSLPIS